MHNPESILENVMHKLIWYFVIESDHLILVRQPDHVTVNKKKRTYQIVDFAVPAEH